MANVTIKKQVAVEFGIPVQFQRFWLWAKRLNNTYRPDRVVTQQEEALPVGNLIKQAHKNAELNLFLEVELGQGLRPIPPPVKSADDILLFFKLYDPLKKELRYVGRLYVKASGMPMDFLAEINGLAGFAPDEDVILFEETTFEPEVGWYLVDKMVTFRVSQLGDGDIICFQKSPKVESTGQCDYPSVTSFLEYVHHNQELAKRMHKTICLELTQMKIIPECPWVAKRKKLLVLDVNGVLAHVAQRQVLHPRPFCKEFLNFCFERFEVAVWSSRKRHNLDKVLGDVMGSQQQKLKFCWDQSHCTDTNFFAKGNCSKPLFLKKLEKIWADPKFGEGYNASNTVLLDDSPYKAFCNPEHTAIFLQSYDKDNTQDNTLERGGALWNYLEELASAEDVREYIKQHPFAFGKRKEGDQDWEVLNSSAQFLLYQDRLV